MFFAIITAGIASKAQEARVSHFENGQALVKSKGEWITIDISGKEVAKN